jgi:uncharacterized protein YecT (DUF1311 family)
MIPWLMLATVSTLATKGATALHGCSDMTDAETEACLKGEAGRADAELAKYLAAARARALHDARIDPTDKELAAVAPRLEQAQAAWEAYRKAECAAIYTSWDGGTIRGAMYQSCWIGLTRLRAHTVWRHWLTFADSTAPILPEPPVPPED